jgi:putative endonuclease
VDYPCDKLKHLDKRYRTRYGMSMIDNLYKIKRIGLEDFMKIENSRWVCPNCGNQICVHNKKCYFCNKFVVYILRTDKNTLYTGYTDDLEKRLLKHREGKGSKYLRSFKSFEIVYREEFDTKSEAMKREAEIKKLTKQQKNLLLKSR